MRFSSRLTILVAVFLLPTLAACGLAVYREHARLSADSIEVARQLADVIGSVLTEALEPNSDPLMVVASEAVAVKTSAGCQATLSKFLDASHNHYLELAVLNEKGAVFCTATGRDRFNLQNHFKDGGTGLLIVRATDEPKAGASLENQTVFIKTQSMPGQNNSDARYLVAVFGLDWLAKRTWQVDLPAKASFVIRDGESHILTKFSAERNDQAAPFQAGRDHSAWVFGETNVKGLNGKKLLQVDVALDRQEIFGESFVRLWTTAAAIVAAVLIYFFLMWLWLRNLIGTPVAKISAALLTVRAGDLESKLSRKNDTLEVGELAASIDRMVEGLVEKSFALDDLRTDQKNQNDIDVRSTRRAVQGRLASRVSEELSEPLGILGGSVLALEAEVQAQDRVHIKLQGLFEQISSSTDRVAKLTTTLNSFADDSSGESFELAQLLPLAQDTLEFARKKMRRAAAFLSFNGFDETTTAYCQPRQVQKILLTLVDNALEAVESVAIRSIFVEAEVKKEWIEISVKDTGPGISRADAEKIFDPFFTNKGGGGSLGLGLTVARAMALENQGDLFIDFTSNKTRFVLKLPRRQHVTRSNLMSGA